MEKRMLLYQELSQQVIGAAIEVHKELGAGLLESAYKLCFARELTLRVIRFRMEVDLPIRYKGILLNSGYRMDFVIEEKILVENKSVEKVIPVHEAQLLSHVRLSGLRVGLLINYNVPVLKDGIIRRVI
jgi:GxxExxY protein